MTVRILTGDCRDVLKTLPDESVHCVVTSPPYWGLRDYGTAKWEGGDPACDHLVAMALQADGWFLRQTIVWAKSNPMPESTTDRCTKAHEYIFMLSRSARYTYDAEAIREPIKPWNDGKMSAPTSVPGAQNWAGITARTRKEVTTLGFSPSCSCNAGTVPGTCLDPFGGAGTTGLVADRLGRNAILIELNPQYAEMARKRLTLDAGLFADVDTYDKDKDFAGSLDVGYAAIRERMAAGGPGWEPKP